MPAVEVKKGNFVVRPTDWDRNFSDNALEIVNEKLQPVLQIIYKRNGLIQIQGIFQGRNGGLIFEAPELPQALPRIFKYPSWKYTGQYAGPADQDVSRFARATDTEFIGFVRKWLDEPKALIRLPGRNPEVLQMEAQNLMTWFYEKALLYRAEFVRRLKDRGDSQADQLRPPLDLQAILKLTDVDKIESISRVLAEVESLANRLEASTASGGWRSGEL